MPKPIKRHQSLQPISREHHHGLLLSWKIRQGLKTDIAAERIKKYVNWFWEISLQSHFEFEENFIFPILGRDHKFTKRALREHGRLKRLIKSPVNLEHNLSLLEEELTAHIRFEERILFNEVQQIASPEQLEKIEQEHSKVLIEDWKDEFWLSFKN